MEEGGYKLAQDETTEMDESINDNTTQSEDLESVREVELKDLSKKKEESVNTSI